MARVRKIEHLWATPQMIEKYGWQQYRLIEYGWNGYDLYEYEYEYEDEDDDDFIGIDEYEIRDE